MLEHFIRLPDPDEPALGQALCRLCARDGGGCCRTDPELTHLSFPLSIPEWRRLAPYSRLAAPTGEDPLVLETAERSPDLPPLDDAAAPPPGGDKACAEEENSPGFIASMHRLFPGRKKRVDSLFPSNERHMTLRTLPDGSCVFLSRYGCILPRSVRPWYCLLFPAWVAKDSLALFASPDCLIAQKAYSPTHGIALLQSTAGTVREQHARLCKDWVLG